MRITADQKIAGYPACQLMRETVGRSITLRYVREILRCSDAAATRVLNRLDEQAGRQEAVRRGLRVVGTLSVLDEADQAGLVSFDQAVAQLRKTSFRVSQAVISEIIQKRSR